MTAPVLFEPPFPMQQIVGAGVGIFLLAVLSYLYGGKNLGPVKRTLLVFLRTLALAGIVIVLCRPMAVRSKPESVDKPVFTVLVDASASMNTKDEGNATRIQAVAAALQSARSTFLEELAQRYQVNFYEFSDEVLPGNFEDLASRQAVKGTKTDIASALFSALQASQGRKHA